ncbi:MAG: bifunctional phosphoribosyl-AMP cyclohydrolase/phosphoribosyl-ATP diphosphatase HisIE [Bacillota bacterium]|nr:bifunctional phosphoribosyl-AMP cyclohydrolase/phosphoribosyl-ATP diphosphatase HisIE [Bacillota bacterium]
MKKAEIDSLVFDGRGLIPAVIQDYRTGQVLMLAYMNRESLLKTIETETTWFYSRSRQSLWNKGETSGNIQRVKGIFADCDKDSLVVTVEQQGTACHTGEKSCFFHSIAGSRYEYSANAWSILEEIYATVEDRRDNPKEGSYTNYLLNKGIDKTLKKIGEESAEVIIAAKNPKAQETICEIADLFYHITVLMFQRGIRYEDIYGELRKRHKAVETKKENE